MLWQTIEGIDGFLMKFLIAYGVSIPMPGSGTDRPEGLCREIPPRRATRHQDRHQLLIRGAQHHRLEGRAGLTPAKQEYDYYDGVSQKNTKCDNGYRQ